MEGYYVLAVIITAVGLWNLLLLIWAYFPGNLATTIGTLNKVTHRQNVQTKHGIVIPNVTDYRYSYTVNGRKYTVSGSRNVHKRTLFKKVSVVYIKVLPQIAYIDKFTGQTQWIISAGFLFLGISLLLILHNTP